MNENQTVELTPEFLEQYSVLSFALSLIVIGLLAGALASWAYLIGRAIRGKPILAVEACAPRVWGLSDVMFIGITSVVCQIVFASAYVRLVGRGVPGDGSGQLSAAVAAAAGFGTIAAVILGLGWLALRFNTAPAHAGFRTEGLWRQLRIGVVATLAVLPVVYVLMAAVSIGLKTEYSHPLLDEVRRNATLGSYLLGVVSAVLIAPLAEEFLFRVLIQGWLQSWPVSTPRQILFGASLADRAASLANAPSLRDGAAMRDEAVMRSEAVMRDWDVEAELVDDRPLTVGIGSTPSEPHSAQLTGAPRDLNDPRRLAVDSGGAQAGSLDFVPPLWPSIVTGILFGLAHWGYGLSFIPLIVLGIVLGLLYRATNSIWPCFLVHFSLNAASMLGLGVSILIERGKQDDLAKLVSYLPAWLTASNL